MLNNQKGFVVPLLVVFVILLIIAGWMFFQSDYAVSLPFSIDKDNLISPASIQL